MKKKYFCKFCYKVYNKKEARAIDFHCCDNPLVDLDEAIADDISIMNRKGYYTDNCCAGHYVKGECARSHPYINFYVENLDIIPWLLQHRPLGFTYSIQYYENDWRIQINEEEFFDEEKYGFTLIEEEDGTCRYTISEKEYDEKVGYRDELLRACIREWVWSLPDLHNTEEEENKKK